jgi:predicted kinase
MVCIRLYPWRAGGYNGQHMPTLFLICGLPGAGKTTLARQIEAERGALRLCPDEWIAALLADPGDRAELDRMRDPVEQIQWQVARRALSLGLDVVLEFGFWSRAERQRFRAEAESLGARVELRYLPASRETLWQRLQQRNADLPPGTFAVSSAELDLWLSWFEPPGPDEFS